MSNENFIGHGACPVCGSDKAQFKYSAKKLAYCTCNGCNVQIFARSDNSDSRLRSFVRAAATPETAMPLAPEPPPATAATVKLDDAVPKKPEVKKPGWGFLGAING